MRWLHFWTLLCSQDYGAKLCKSQKKSQRIQHSKLHPQYRDVRGVVGVGHPRNGRSGCQSILGSDPAFSTNSTSKRKGILGKRDSVVKCGVVGVRAGLGEGSGLSRESNIPFMAARKECAAGRDGTRDGSPGLAGSMETLSCILETRNGFLCTRNGILGSSCPWK